MELGTTRGVAARPSRTTSVADATRWLVCGSAKGGAGKTTLSVNLASIAAGSGLRVGLVDTDTQRTASFWHATRPAEAPAIELFTVPLRDVGRAIVEVEAASWLDLVIVDTPPGVDDRPVEIKRLLQKADFVLVPCTQGSPDVRSVVEFMAVLDREETPGAFVLNRAQRSFVSYQEARRDLNRSGPLCPVDIRQLEDIQSTHRYGLGITEIRRAKGADDFENVWAFVRRELKL